MQNPVPQTDEPQCLIARRSYRILPLTLLAWLGRQGARAVAALVFLGIIIPPLGTLLRPFVTEAIFLLLTISFSRVDTIALQGHLHVPLSFWRLRSGRTLRCHSCLAVSCSGAG